MGTLKKISVRTVVAVLLGAFCIWCFIALLLSPALELDVGEMDVHSDTGCIAFRYDESPASVNARSIVVKCCDTEGNTVFTTRHSSPSGGTDVGVRFIGDRLAVYISRDELIRVYDLEGNLITDHDIDLSYFEVGSDAFEENVQALYEASGIRYNCEKGSFMDFLLLRMYYRLVAVRENGDTVVIYQSK